MTPVFEGDNLVASGVLIEAESVEDNGDGITFCVYCYNVQPGDAIDYTTGSCSEEQTESSVAADSQTDAQASGTTGETGTYVLNTNTMKFHYPSCSSVAKIKDKNKQEYTGSRADLISQGYEPCKICNP